MVICIFKNFLIFLKCVVKMDVYIGKYKYWKIYVYVLDCKVLFYFLIINDLEMLMNLWIIFSYVFINDWKLLISKL